MARRAGAAEVPRAELRRVCPARRALRQSGRGEPVQIVPCGGGQKARAGHAFGLGGPVHMGEQPFAHGDVHALLARFEGRQGRGEDRGSGRGLLQDGGMGGAARSCPGPSRSGRGRPGRRRPCYAPEDDRCPRYVDCFSRERGRHHGVGWLVLEMGYVFVEARGHG